LPDSCDSQLATGISRAWPHPHRSECMQRSECFGYGLLGTRAFFGEQLTLAERGRGVPSTQPSHSRLGLRHARREYHSVGLTGHLADADVQRISLRGGVSASTVDGVLCTETRVGG